MQYIKCQFIEGCPIAQYFGQAGWTLFASRYCREGQFEACQRFKLRATGQPVPPHMLPWDQPGA